MSVMAAARRAWATPLLALLAVTCALGLSLGLPALFSDPNGVDPYMVRLSITSLLMLAVAWARPATVAARPVLIAVAAAAVSFTVLSALPQLLFNVFCSGTQTAASPCLGQRVLSGDALQLWASIAQLLVTIALAALVLVVPARLRPVLRLRHFGVAAVIAALAGSVLLVLVVLALPAQWLGRFALQPVAIARDLPWLGPANALQGLAQEVQFRGLLMGALERVMPRGWANVVQACFFGLSHLAVNYEGPVGPFVPVTIAVGLLFGWVVQRTRSLWPAVIIHALADVLIVVGVMPGLYGY
jgi:membrane protease YdiL (CAAX protease family)